MCALQAFGDVTKGGWSRMANRIIGLARSGAAGARRWFFGLVAVGMGVLVGVGVFTFEYANGAAYLSNDPAGCVNCHVMRENYDGWVKSSHGKVAVCNDCHTPHNFIGKWTTKAVNGWNHGLAFTTGRFPDNIQIRDHNLRVTEESCLFCHESVVEGIQATRPHDQKISCVTCHSNVGHLR